MEVAELERSSEPGSIKFTDGDLDITKGLNMVEGLMRCKTAFNRTVDRILYHSKGSKRCVAASPYHPNSASGWSCKQTLSASWMNHLRITMQVVLSKPADVPGTFGVRLPSAA